MNNYTAYFGFKKQPFISDLAVKDLMQLPATLSVHQRMDYILGVGGLMAITGDVGCGKSTSLRWALSQYHPSEVLAVNVVANSGSTNELYKQLCWALDLDVHSASKALLMKEFKSTLKDLVSRKKQKVIVLIDEANLLRVDVFAELHTLTQFEYDSKNLFALVLAGQSSLIDKLTYRSSLPLASRIITRTHLSSLGPEQMADYLKHHLKIAGVKNNLFDQNATIAIHQASSGILRKANSLAIGALMACMIEQENSVTAEHVRIASTELI